MQPFNNNNIPPTFTIHDRVIPGQRDGRNNVQPNQNRRLGQQVHVILNMPHCSCRRAPQLVRIASVNPRICAICQKAIRN